MCVGLWQCFGKGRGDEKGAVKSFQLGSVGCEDEENCDYQRTRSCYVVKHPPFPQVGIPMRSGAMEMSLVWNNVKTLRAEVRGMCERLGSEVQACTIPAHVLVLYENEVRDISGVEEVGLRILVQEPTCGLKCTALWKEVVAVTPFGMRN